MPAALQHAEIELPLSDGRRIRLHRIGPAAHGWTYYTPNRDACYRLIPLNGAQPRDAEQAPIEHRTKYFEWEERQAGKAETVAPPWAAQQFVRDIAPILHQGSAPELGCYFVGYRIQHIQSLCDVLDSEKMTARERLLAVAQVFYRIPHWWEAIGHGLLPMPADIVLDSSRRPVLLPAAPWRMPEQSSIFAAPERSSSLAPEYLRGHAASAREMDRYALGALAMRVFRRRSPTQDPAVAMLRGASGAAWRDLPSALPSWLQRAPATSTAENAVGALLAIDPAERAKVDIARLATTLDQCAERMQPREAILELKAVDRLADAYALLQDVMLEDNSYEMCMLAGEIAFASKRALEAVDYYEKALERMPGDLGAAGAQFEVLTSKRCREEVKSLIAQQPGLGDRMNEKVWRDFQIIDQQDRSFTWENDLVSYMRWRDMEEHAAPWIYSRLFDAKGVFLWWKFPLRCQYVRTLFWAGRQATGPDKDQRRAEYMAQARQQLDSIKAELIRCRQDGKMTEHLDHYFDLARDTEEEMVTLIELFAALQQTES